MSGVLKAKVGGVWVPIVGSGMSAETARWNSAWGVVARARSASGLTSVPGTAPTSVTTQVAVTLLAGRRYQITYNARAIGASPTGTWGMNFKLYDNGTDTGWIDQWHSNVTGGPAGYDGKIVSSVVTGDGVARLLDVRVAGSSGVALGVYDDAYTGLIIEDVGPAIYNPAPTPPQTPTAWTNLTLINGWTPNSGIAPQYRKVGDRVELRGRADGTQAMGTITNLPVGFRPGQNLVLAGSVVSAGAWAPATLYLPTNGDVSVLGGTYTSVSLSSLTFSITP